MTQAHCNTTKHKGTHLTYEERIRIETLKGLGFSNRAIARELGRAPQTIHNEIKRGTTRQISRQKYQDKVYEYEQFQYIPSLAQQNYHENRRRCGARPLWLENSDFVTWADDLMIQQLWSPEAVVAYAHRENIFPSDLIPCVTTLYAWIDNNIMATKNIHLLEKLKRHTSNPTYHRTHRRVLGPSIEQRPQDVESRQTFGHWGIDTVIGTKDKSKPVILTLVERATRFETLTLIDNKSADSVIQGLKAIFKDLKSLTPHIFKSITADNGSEFASLYEEFGHDIDIYFAHPFSSFERGTSENQHKMLRRFIPKGTDLSTVSQCRLKHVQQFMNDYPRKILGYDTAHHRMAQALKALKLL